MKLFKTHLEGAVKVFISKEGRYCIEVNKSFLELPRGIRINFSRRSKVANMTFAYSGVSSNFLTYYSVPEDLLHRVVNWLLLIVSEDRLFDSKVPPRTALKPPSMVQDKATGYLVRVHSNGVNGSTGYWIDPITGKRNRIFFSTFKGTTQELMDNLLEDYLNLEWTDEDILANFKPTEEYIHYIRNAHIGQHIEEVIHLLGA